MRIKILEQEIECEIVQEHTQPSVASEGIPEVVVAPEVPSQNTPAPETAQA